MKQLIRGILKFLYGIKSKFLPDFQLGRLPFLQNVVNKLTLQSRIGYVENILGHKMYLDEQDSLALSTRGIYEPFETMFFQEKIKDGQYVLDIGANIGYYTLLFARQVGPQGRVYAFEPEPGNFDVLSRNVDINGYKNVVAVNKAVSDKTGTLDLVFSEENRGDHRTFQIIQSGKIFKVDAVALDDYFKSLDHPIDWIKMDIQGAEFHALKGMERLLRENIDMTLVIEFWPAGQVQAGSDPRACLEFLLSIGFDIYELDAPSRSLKKAEVDYLLKTYPPQPYNTQYTDLVCKKIKNN